MKNEKNKARFYVVIRYVALVLLTALLCVVEKTWYSLDVGLSPFLTAALCAAVGYYTSISLGMGFGLTVGLISNAIGGSSIYILPVLYLLYGALAGVLGEHMYRERLLSAIVPLSAAITLEALYRAFVLLLGCGFRPQGMGNTFLSLGSACLMTLLLGFPLFLLVRVLAKERETRKVRSLKRTHKRI